MFEPASKSMPAIDYVSMVRAVYGDRRAMLVAVLSCAVASGAAAFKTHSMVLWAITAVFVFISIGRFFAISSFIAARVGPTDVVEAEKWELRATYWATAMALTCGLWCVASFLLVDDAFAELISMTTTVACMVGIVTRNFGLVRMLNIQLAIAVALLCGSLLFKGNFYYPLLGVLLLPMLVSFKFLAADVRKLRDFLTARPSKVRIIAKIEDQSAITNLDEIVTACDSLMVARGDLGIECPFEDLPVIQRRAVNACLSQGKPVIIATHMLESMISQPVPTRAEITDVANAVYELSDCVMLSGETTVGKYPLECVQMLDKIARRIEREDQPDVRPVAVFTDERMKVLHSAVVLANELPHSKLLTFTRHGFMAHGLAALRPMHSPIFTFTPSPEVFRQLRLLRAVEPFLMPFSPEPDTTIENAIGRLKLAGVIAPGDKLIVATDIVSQDRLVDSVQLRTVR